MQKEVYQRAQPGKTWVHGPWLPSPWWQSSEKQGSKQGCSLPAVRFTSSRQLPHCAACWTVLMFFTFWQIAPKWTAFKLQPRQDFVVDIAQSARLMSHNPVLPNVGGSRRPVPCVISRVRHSRLLVECCKESSKAFIRGFVCSGKLGLPSYHFRVRVCKMSLFKQKTLFNFLPQNASADS